MVFVSMSLAVFLKLFLQKATSHLQASFAASHFIACTCTQDVAVSGANITVCVYLWVSQSLLRFCFWSSLSPHYGAYIIQQNMYYCLWAEYICSLTNIPSLSLSLCLSVGPGRECPLWWRISMHREPPRTSPSSRENRGHRRLAAPLLPVSSLITACHICTITHTHICM